ncbi:hypothetical protein RHSIM_Rhsim12G0049200 [Rhododendron simsii]|uniref:Uncharacterized protein n=1 Tax=Rhododendron simsii TaxID=118357 RepID=A0A834L8X9_RHOSS|nr:hypothetical protein RHSIM_Rhsim12G0049200 [Rhododendron simsii]
MTDLLFKTKTYAMLTYFALGATISSIAATYWISLSIISKDVKTTDPKRITVYIIGILGLTLVPFLLFRMIARIVGEKKRRNRARVNRLSLTNNQASENEANV